MMLESIAAHDITGERTSKRLSPAPVRRTIARILKKNTLCAIATAGPDGRVHVNTAYFACSAGLELYFLSHPASLHCRNLAEHPRIAIAVFDSTQAWGRLDRGLQLFGVCREARGPAGRKVERTYAARFKPYSKWQAELDADDTAREYRFYRFVTQRVKVLDEREFGGAVLVTATIRR
ncbi:MAG: pyridoxamine 5'-phosphate oxidase family protein [Acidobacteria bacterium]|nr:pyridoxamine 5'-phosphate oxidase family protein [Acidobacteriota bacterium]